MNCDGVRPLLSAYIDGELSGGELLRVQQHLRRCHWCAAEVDALRQTIALVTSLDEVEPPDTFHAELHQRLLAADPPLVAARKANRRLTRRAALGRWAIPAAAAAALVIGVSGLNRLVLPGPAAQPPQQQENVVLLPTGQEPQPGSTGTVEPPVSQGGVGEPGSVNVPGDETPSGAEGPVDSNDITEPVAQPGESPSQSGLPGEANVPESEPGEADSGPKGSPLGPTNPGGGVSTATQGNEPGTMAALPPQQHLRASLEVAVADPEQAARELQERLSLARAIRMERRVSAVELQVTVAAADFEEAVAQVETQFRGQNASAVRDSVDLSAQLESVRERLVALENQRASLEQRPQGEADPKALATLVKEIEELQATRQNLLTALENAEIQIVLKAQPLQ